MGPTFSIPRRTTFTWVRVGALALVAALVCIAHYGWWTAADWERPTAYGGDALEMLARIKAASEGDTWPLRPQVISRLGAPFGADWNDYPASDKLLVLLLGGLARVIGVIPAANVGLLLAQVSAALAFYGAMRVLRRRWEWAFAGALLFAFSYHTFTRGVGHMLLTFTWTVPLAVVSCWLIARSRRIDVGNTAGWLCLASAFALGVSMPYYLFFFLQLLFWALVAHACGRRRAGNLRVGLAALVLAIAAFYALHLEVWLYSAEPGARPLLARNFAGAERYALKLVECVIPPFDHRIDLLAFMGNRYNRWVDWRGEPLLPYLGLVGIGGLIWLLLSTLRSVFRGRAPRGDMLQIVWIFVYTTVGGLTSVAALYLSLQIFRASNRAAIFIVAIVLAFVVGRLSHLTRAWPAAARAGAALLLAAFGLLDQIPKPMPAENRRAIADRVAMDAVFAREMEAALPQGAMIYQLPALGFPEIVPPHRMEDYEHFRTYVHSESLRFSYGSPKFRASSRWKRDLEELPTAELVGRLESYGFAAIHVNRRGYDDSGEAILGELERLGYTDRIRSSNLNQVVIRLRPSPEPATPLASVFTLGHGWENFSPRPGREYDRSRRRAYADASLGYYNPFPEPLSARLRLTMSGAGPRDLEVRFNGERMLFEPLSGEPRALPTLELSLQPGYNRLDFSSPQPANALASAPGEPKTSFALHTMELDVAAKPGAAP